MASFAALVLLPWLALAGVTPSAICEGLEMHTAGVSADEKWVLMAEGASGSLVILDARLHAGAALVRRWAASTRDGRQTAHHMTVHTAPPRASFVVVLPDIGELWEISYDPQAEPQFEGLVHDYRMGEGLATPGFWGVRRTQLPSTPSLPTTLYFSADFRNLVYLRQDAEAIRHHAVVVNLDVRRAIADVPLPTPPPSGSGLTLVWGSHTLSVTPAVTDESRATDRARSYCKP